MAGEEGSLLLQLEQQPRLAVVAEAAGEEEEAEARLLRSPLPAQDLEVVAEAAEEAEEHQRHPGPRLRRARRLVEGNNGEYSLEPRCSQHNLQVAGKRPS